MVATTHPADVVWDRDRVNVLASPSGDSFLSQDVVNDTDPRPAGHRPDPGQRPDPRPAGQRPDAGLAALAERVAADRHLCGQCRSHSPGHGAGCSVVSPKPPHAMSYPTAIPHTRIKPPHTKSYPIVIPHTRIKPPHTMSYPIVDPSYPIVIPHIRSHPTP